MNLIADFSIANRGITTQTVAAGGTAQYINDLGITPFFGFSSTVTVSCSVNAPKSSCTVTPNSYAQASGIGTIAVTTTAPQSSANRRLGNVRFKMALAFPIFAVVFFAFDSRRRRLPGLGLVAILLGMSLACGGGGSGGGGGGGGGTPGTPAGTYTVTVTGVSSSLTHTTSFTLVVQ